MKKITLASISFILFQSFFGSFCIAQNTPGTTTDTVNTVEKEHKFNIALAAAYSPRLNYYGRTDSLKSSAIIPTIVIQAGKHFTFTPAFIFISNNQATFNYTAATVNATYSFGKKKGIAGTVYADKYFYASSSKLVQSAQQGQAGFTLSYLNKIVNITGGSSAAFSSANTDVFATATLDHKFKKVKGINTFLVIPGVVANAGTQHFTYSYYKKNNFLFFPTTDQLVTENSKRFSLLSYDINLSMIYAVKRFIVNVTPGYVLPQNVITVSGNAAASEKASNIFYCNVVLIYKLVK